MFPYLAILLGVFVLQLEPVNAIGQALSEPEAVIELLGTLAGALDGAGETVCQLCKLAGRQESI
jgi:hypothetical protein